VHLISENQEQKLISTSADNQNDNRILQMGRRHAAIWSSENNFALFSVQC
jgi:hypothetical protein